MKTIIYPVKPFRVILKSKTELISMGYEPNDDPYDFINLIAGKSVIINKELGNGKVFICKEFPDYAIYDIFIRAYVSLGTSQIGNSYDYSLLEIAKHLKVTPQRINKIVNGAMKKLQKIVTPDKAMLFDAIGEW